MSRRVSSVVFGIALLASGLASGEESHVRARLVADRAASGSTPTATVGVLFEMDPGWHIYWSNPGDAGLATAVEWHLPDGYSAGPLQWPTPMSFTQPGDLAAFGYERSVVLASQVTIPQTVTKEGAAIAASVSWLACKDVCVLGGAELEERWPLESAPGVFADWRDRLPMPDGPFALSFADGLAADDRRGDVSVWLEWSQNPGDVEFYPDAGKGIKISETRVQTRGRLTRIDFDVTIIGGGDGAVDRVPSVVVSADRTGVRRGWVFDAPLREDLDSE